MFNDFDPSNPEADPVTSDQSHHIRPTPPPHPAAPTMPAPESAPAQGAGSDGPVALSWRLGPHPGLAQTGSGFGGCLKKSSDEMIQRLAWMVCWFAWWFGWETVCGFVCEFLQPDATLASGKVLLLMGLEVHLIPSRCLDS